MKLFESSLTDTKKQSIINLQQLIFQYNGKSKVSIHCSVLNKTVMVLWRFIAFIAISVRMWFVLHEATSTFYAFQYLTQLGFQFSWLYFICVCIDFIIIHIPGIFCPMLPDVVNLLFQIAWCLQVPITILYWGVLFDFSVEHEAIDLVKDIGVHGFPFFCLLIDFIFNCYQFPWKHLPIVLVIGTLYLIVNLVYTLEVHPIYSVIDWVSVMSYLWVVLAFVVVLGVFLLSRWIWMRWRSKKIEQNVEVSMLSEGLF